MILLIHYIVRNGIVPLHFNFTLGGSEPDGQLLNGANLESIKSVLAVDAGRKVATLPHTQTIEKEFTASDITIAGVFPLPSGNSAPREIPSNEPVLKIASVS